MSQEGGPGSEGFDSRIPEVSSLAEAAELSDEVIEGVVQAVLKNDGLIED